MVPCNHTLTRGPPRPGGDCLERLGPDDQKELPRTKNCGSGRHGQAQEVQELSHGAQRVMMPRVVLQRHRRRPQAAYSSCCACCSSVRAPCRRRDGAGVHPGAMALLV